MVQRIPQHKVVSLCSHHLFYDVNLVVSPYLMMSSISFSVCVDARDVGSAGSQPPKLKKEDVFDDPLKAHQKDKL